MKKMNYFIALCISATLVLSSCGGGDCPKVEGGGGDSTKAATEQANIAAYKKMGDDWVKGDKQAVMDFMADNYVDHNPDTMMTTKRGKEAMAEMFDQLYQMQDNMTFTITNITAEGDLLYAWGKYSATMKMDMPAMGGMPAVKCKGKSYSCDFAEVVKMKDGKMIERWGLMDFPTMMAQLSK